MTECMIVIIELLMELCFGLCQTLLEPSLLGGCYIFAFNLQCLRAPQICEGTATLSISLQVVFWAWVLIKSLRILVTLASQSGVEVGRFGMLAFGTGTRILRAGDEMFLTAIACGVVSTIFMIGALPANCLQKDPNLGDRDDRQLGFCTFALFINMRVIIPSGALAIIAGILKLMTLCVYRTFSSRKDFIVRVSSALLLPGFIVGLPLFPLLSIQQRGLAETIKQLTYSAEFCCVYPILVAVCLGMLAFPVVYYYSWQGRHCRFRLTDQRPALSAPLLDGIAAV